jgi:hypothetical protein
MRPETELVEIANWPRIANTARRHPHPSGAHRPHADAPHQPQKTADLILTR